MPLPVTPLKQKQLEKRMAELGLLEEDIEEKFVRGSGSGGQKINKTSSCVYLMHNPSGLEVKCQKERSQAMNRFFARRELCEKMAEQIEGEKSKKQQAREKIRRQKRRRSRRQKDRMLDDKSKQSDKKVRRRKVDMED